MGRRGWGGALVALLAWGCGGRMEDGEARAPESVAEAPPDAVEPPPEVVGSPGEHVPQEPTPFPPPPEPPRTTRRYASACSRSDYLQTGLLRALWRYGADGGLREEAFFSMEGEPLTRLVQQVEGGLVRVREEYYRSEFRMREAWTYREDGKALRLDVAERGADTRAITWTYGDAGELLRAEHSDKEGRRTGFTAYFYDGQGRLEREDHANGDGVVLDQILYAYGPHGRVSEISKDVGPLVYTAKTWQYHPNGQVAREDIRGETSHIWREFDTAGREVRNSRQLDESGGTEELTYDARGLLIRKQSQSAGSSGTSAREETFEYDAERRLISQRLVWDYTNNWTGEATRVRESYRYGYDARGELVLQTCDTNEDDAPDWRRTFTRDAFGNLLEERLEGQARPIELGRTVYTYECHD